jgi:hypothetical protein
MISKKFKEEKAKLRASLGKIKGVIGLGLGRKESNGSLTEELSVRVYVKKKVGKGDLGEHRIPETVTLSDGTVLKTDVVEVGEIKFRGFTGTYRPAQPGAIIGAENGWLPGTFGATATDNTDGQKVILTCSHVLTNFDELPNGTPVLQPAPQFGGTNADRIGELKRSVPFDFSPYGINYVDAAIASPDAPNLIKTAPFCANVKPAKQGAVGLLFAASEYITIINPIDNVLSLLNVSLPKTKEATVGMSIHACTATTGYVSTTVYDIMVDLLLQEPNGNDVWFLDQVICVGGVADGFGGDSGSVFYTTFNV